MIINKCNFDEKQYIKEETEKTQIVLHHTVSDSNNIKGVLDWWESNTERVATAYIINKNGHIFEVFDPKYWAYHIGKGSTTEDNKKSIGIELVNVGPLTKIDDKYYWWNGTKEYKGEIYECREEWRGSKYYASYTIEQMLAVGSLVKALCLRFKIPKIINMSYGYKSEYMNWEGVVSHHNLRADKSDVSRAFNYEYLNYGI